MPLPTIPSQTETTITRTHTIRLRDTQIISLAQNSFDGDIPTCARVFFTIPSYSTGGDDVDIDDSNLITITWTEVTQS